MSSFEHLESGSWVHDAPKKKKQRQAHIEVLELKADGTTCVLLMRMREVMRRLARAIDGDEEESDSLLGKRQNSFSARHATSRWIHARDLRSMDPAYSHKAAHPGIVVRRNLILANFDPLRVVIVHDRMIAFVNKQHADLPALLEDLSRELRLASAAEMTNPTIAPVDSDDNLAINAALEEAPRAVRDKLDAKASSSASSLSAAAAKASHIHPSSRREDVDGGDDEAVPFELRALEAILAVATRRLASDCDQRLTVRTTQLIEQLRSTRMSLEHLEKLRRLKNEVSYQEARVRDTVEAINATLDSDEDMCMMRLSSIRAEPHLYDPPLSADMLTEHEDVEDILENYLMHVTAIQTRLELLRVGIENAVDLFTMKLDIARNRIISADTIFNLVAMCLAFCAVVGGFYGMNLNISGQSFHYVIAVTVGICLLIASVVFTLLYRANILLF